jgi:hypothetical protein
LTVDVAGGVVVAGSDGVVAVVAVEGGWALAGRESSSRERGDAALSLLMVFAMAAFTIVAAGSLTIADAGCEDRAISLQALQMVDVVSLETRLVQFRPKQIFPLFCWGELDEVAMVF